jgi:prepilin signal peptidase PulO-like enzyme (type II secretory pathway)
MLFIVPSFILYGAAAVLGATVGSFANVLIFRYGSAPPTGRSACPHCQHQLSASDLIPIFSYLFLHGQCRYCQAKISPRYPLVELATAVSALLILVSLPSFDLVHITVGVIDFVIIATLVVLFVIDLRTMLLPDIYVAILAVAVAVRLLLTTYYLLITGAIGALLGAGLLGILWIITQGRGLGLGDVKLMIPLGALFGHMDTALLLLVAFVIGGIMAAILLITKKVTMKTAVPFGPFLAGTAILFILWPQLPQYLAIFIFGNSFTII